MWCKYSDSTLVGPWVSPVTFLNPWLHLRIPWAFEIFWCPVYTQGLIEQHENPWDGPRQQHGFSATGVSTGGLEAGMEYSESMPDVNVKASEELSGDDKSFGSREPQYYSAVCTRWLHLCFEHSTKIIFKNSSSQISIHPHARAPTQVSTSFYLNGEEWLVSFFLFKHRHKCTLSWDKLFCAPTLHLQTM